MPHAVRFLCALTTAAAAAAAASAGRAASVNGQRLVSGGPPLELVLEHRILRDQLAHRGLDLPQLGLVSARDGRRPRVRG
eukprot:6524084-Prymnesium_polylepis.1